MIEKMVFVKASADRVSMLVRIDFASNFNHVSITAKRDIVECIEKKLNRELSGLWGEKEKKDFAFYRLF
jgi:hypothetical protein